MKIIFLSAAILCIFSFNISCNDGLYGNCSSLSGKYCPGVEYCTDYDEEMYIKVGSERYYCAKSLQWEDTFDCSYGYSLAEEYCENSNIKVTKYPECYRTDAAGNNICYGYFMNEEKCNACGWTYSIVDCDSISSVLSYSPPHCH